MMRVTSKGSSKRRSLLSETTRGLFLYRVSHRIVFGVMAMEAVASLFGLNHTMLTIFASDILRVGAHGFGLLQSARGLGAVIGSSFYIGVGQQPHQGKILFVSAILYGAAFALFGISPVVPVVAFTHGVSSAPPTPSGAHPAARFCR